MKNFTSMMDTRIKNALNALRKPFRARLTALDTKPKVQLVQADGLNGEQMQAVQLMQQFGFTSGVPKGSELMILPLAGKTVASVIVATENGNYRIEVNQGETCVYNQWGAKITLKKEKIVEVDCDHFIVKAKETVKIETKEYTNTASDFITENTKVKTTNASTRVQYNTPALGMGGDGEACTMTMKGNIKQDGSHQSTGDQVAGSISQINHVHVDVMPGDGSTGKPK